MNSTPQHVVDSHLHVWSDSGCPYAEGKAPPAELAGEVSSVESLLAHMESTGTAATLIVQPANYMFDHSYMISCMERFPDKFGGMMLLDPTLSPAEACATVRQLAKKGVTGIRFNPALWAAEMDDSVGVAVFELCAELELVVGVMAFNGLVPQIPSIRRLCTARPTVAVVIDHMGFPRASPGEAPNGQSFDEEAWAALLDLGKDFSQIHVKISALFRVSSEGGAYADLFARFQALAVAFGSERLLYGSDFPWAMLHGKYGDELTVVRAWAEATFDKQGAAAVLGGNASRLFKLPVTG